MTAARGMGGRWAGIATVSNSPRKLLYSSTYFLFSFLEGNEGMRNTNLTVALALPAVCAADAGHTGRGAQSCGVHSPLPEILKMAGFCRFSRGISLFPSPLHTELAPLTRPYYSTRKHNS